MVPKIFLLLQGIGNATYLIERDLYKILEALFDIDFAPTGLVPCRDGSVAQWQSGRLISDWSQVRSLPDPPFIFLINIDFS